MAEKNQKAPPKGLGKPNLSAANAKEVAERAGVSVMTVSRALRGLSNVSPATRDRILSVARELGYSPSLAARSLRTGKVQIVGFVSAGQDALRGPYNSDMLAGLDAAMVESDYHVLLVLVPTLEQLAARTEQVVREGRVGGVVVLGTQLRSEDVEAMSKLSAPSVLLNYSDEHAIPEPLTSVSYDNAGGLELVVRHLAALGHKEIAYIGGTSGHHDAEDREAGFRRAMKNLGLKLREKWVRPGDFAHSVETGTMQADYLLSEGSKGPTAIVCASDNIAAGVLLSARRAGRHIPEDLSVVGFDNEMHSGFQVPPLTTVDHSGWHIGRRAGELILERLLSKSVRSGVRESLPVSLVVRDTTAPPPAARRR